MIGSLAANACRGLTGQRRGARRGFRLGLERLDQRLARAGWPIAVAGPRVAAHSILEVEMVTPTTNIQVSTSAADLSTEPAFALRFNHALNPFSIGTQDFIARQAGPAHLNSRENEGFSGLATQKPNTLNRLAATEAWKKP